MAASGFDRVLIANRGALARRLIRSFAEEEVETVSVFHGPDVDQPWVEEADYGVYLNGQTVAETYLHTNRVVGAALDAGCDAVHPGSGYLGESLEFHGAAERANVGIVGTDTQLLRRIGSRFELHQKVRSLGIATIPCSEDIPDGSDMERIANTADHLGYPVDVLSSFAPVSWRAASREALPNVVAAVRDEGERLAQDRTVYLQGRAKGQHTLGSIVVADRHGSLIHLANFADSISLHGRWWLAELGPSVASEVLQGKVAEYSLTIAKAVDWEGIGVMRWAVTPSGATYFVGVSLSLPAPYLLIEQLLGVDLVRTQVRLFQGEWLGWEHHDVSLERHGLMLRLIHIDPADGSRPEGTLERFQLPDDVLCEPGTLEGLLCTLETDPVLAEMVVVGPTRQAALVKARAAVERTAIEGVKTNREALLALFDQETFWRGEYDVDTLPALLE
ncbi:MAG: hypothetical protein JRI25_01270 [Deltaproteobacteria bacterium]|nr:hypothetical protein [Deltaproteobacteria bacterium]MBW2253209.1 hypothetical protein [Deltaproteobacteria bacterium]